MKHNSSELLSNFVGRKCNSIQKQNDRECLWQYKKPVKHGICKQDYIWNPSIKEKFDELSNSQKK